MPNIRRTLLPLWSAWVLAFIGAGCGVLLFELPDMSAGLSSTLASGAFVGAVSLLLVVCYYLFGDSHRPYSREVHAVLEPTYAYYPLSSQQVVVAALEAHDEKALEAIKRQAKPELALVRYSDKGESVFYSQLTRVEGKRYVPLTDIIVNKIK